MTDKQVKKTESASFPKIIAKCGYNRNMALDIRGGPKELGGASFYAFLNTIGATRVQHFIKNWRTPNEDIGKALRIAVAWTHYSAGVPYPILLKTKQDLSYVKSRTVLTTRNYLHKSHGVIHLDTTYVQHPKRENDVSIMHLVNTQTNRNVNINQKEKINCVRMYLGVNYVSEICTIDGASFVPGILECDDYQLNYQTTITKPNQEKLGDHSWMLWRRILKMLTSAQTTKTNNLKQRLGKWTDTHSKSGQWLSYQDSNGRFYARESHQDTELEIFEQTNRGTQLTCIDTTKEYQPTKYSTPV